MKKLLMAAVALVFLVALGCGGGEKKEAAAPAAPAAAPASAGQAAPAPAVAPKPAAPGVATAPTPKYGGTLVHRGRADPLSDPTAGASATDEHRVYHFIYNRLFTPFKGSPPCQLWPASPDLAESWKWLDDRTLEVKLRSGARFPDVPPVNGREITAEDVVSTIQRTFRLLPHAKPASDLTASVQTIDKGTVRFTLKNPFPSYLEDVLAQRWALVMPKEILPQDVSMKWGDHIGMGGGPFVLKSYSPSIGFEFVKNPNYFQKDLPYLAAISEPIILEESTMLAGFRTGKIDTGEVRTTQLIAELQRTDPQLQRQVCPYAAPFVLEMRNDRAPMKEIKVRQALSMAIDREAMGKVAWAGQFFPKHSPVHSGLGDWALQFKDYPPEAAKVITYNPAEAKRLMTEAGYPNGFEVSMSYGPHLPGQTPLAEFLTSAWGEVGVKIKLKAYDRATFVRTSSVQGDTPEDMLLQFASSATVYEALYHYFKCGLPRNLSRVCDPEVDRLIDQLVLLPDEKARRAVANDLQKYLVQKQFRLELPQSVAAQFFQPWVKNVWYRTDAWADADYVKFAWLDK